MLYTGQVSAQSVGYNYDVSDTTRQVSLLFRFDKATVDAGFEDNAQSLEILRSILTDTAVVNNLDSIIIVASASPEGAPSYNANLARRRAIAVKYYILQQYSHIDTSLVSANADRKYWEGLVRLVEDNPDVPYREELLKMIGNPDLSDDVKSRRMASMRGGTTFMYLRDKYILRRLRASEALIKFHYAVLAPDPEPKPVPPMAADPEPEVPIEPEPVVEIPFIFPDREVTYPFALRTNLLLDIVGGANLGVEVPIGEHFSVAGDFAYAYTRINNLYALQTIQGDVEGRYWFKRGKNLMTGWNVGIYGMYCSRFDIQWKGGYQGDGFWSAGLSGGYSVPLSKNFNLDFSVTGGFIHSPEVRHYSRPQDGHLIWKETRYNVSRVFLTQVRVNLVWLVKTNKKAAK